MVSTTGCAEVRCAGRRLSEAYKDPVALELVKAAVKGNADKVDSLIKAGAKPNHKEDDAVPMLLWCICADNARGFEALLKGGADPNLGGTGGGKGDGKGHGLMENGTIIYEGWSATVMAGGTANPEFLRLALKYGGNPNAKRGDESPAGSVPILEAAYNGLFDNIKLLVDAGADINVHDSKFVGYTIPDNAVGGRGRFDIALWCLEHGYKDLRNLAKKAENCIASDPQQKHKEELVRRLRGMGVEIPTPGMKEELLARRVPAELWEDVVLGTRAIGEWQWQGAPKR